MEAYKNFLKFFNNLYRKESEKYFSKIKKIYKKNYFLDDIFNYLLKFMQEGKRIRPFIIWFIYHSLNQKNKNLEELKNCCFAIEAIHTFAIVQDDFMDNSSKRRDLETINFYIKNKYKKNFFNIDHFSNSIAVLLSDLCFNFAYYFILKLQNKEAKILFNNLINEVDIGQVIDFYLSKKKHFNVDKKSYYDFVYQKNFLKTAGYSFVNPAKIALSYSSIDKKEENNILKFFENLGIFFQIQDDLIDIEFYGNSNKNTFLDIYENQKTLYTFYIKYFLNKNKNQYFNIFLNRKISKFDKKELKKFFEKNGVYSFLENELNKYLKLSNFYLNKIKNDNLRMNLKELSSLIEQRKK